jgi:hypothetical protein
MNTVFFDTPGTLDVRAITTFGLSAKETDNPIGFFGTGLKYALAILVRQGAVINITSDDETHEFTTERQTFRNKEFTHVLMNGKQLPFTTDLGKTWELWMAFRELHSNTIDEGGNTHADDTQVIGPGNTRISISLDAFYSVYLDRGSYFLEGPAAAASLDYEMFDKPSSHMFYKRIRAGDLAKQSKYTYSYRAQMELTEDRTIKYAFMWDDGIPRLIMNCGDKDIIKEVVLATEVYMEHELQFRPHMEVSDEFMSVMEPLANDHSGRVNGSAQALYKKRIKKDMTNDDSVELNTVEKTQLAKAKKVCNALGLNPDKYPVIILNSLGLGVLGMVQDNKIFLAKESFAMGTKMLAGTLYEELVHLEFNCHDCTRAMQNLLINRIMTAYEDSIGEPM